GDSGGAHWLAGAVCPFERFRRNPTSNAGSRPNCDKSRPTHPHFGRRLIAIPVRLSRLPDALSIFPARPFPPRDAPPPSLPATNCWRGGSRHAIPCNQLRRPHTVPVNSL